MKTFVATIVSLAASAALASPLTVHEWGTFTSVAGDDGEALTWHPLAHSKLPSFVYQSQGDHCRGKGCSDQAPGLTIRMETPVLYFYSPRSIRVSARVRFPQGRFTEWYPRAVAQGDSLAWSDVVLGPQQEWAFPAEGSGNHYYAARDTDASPLQVGEEKEKFLFYRGVGTFQPPVAARVSDRKLTVDSQSGAALGTVIVFERVGPNAGYSIVPIDGHKAVIDRPALSWRPEAIEAELAKILVSRGLYDREAKAMVATWKGDWFEKGLRVFYFVPDVAVSELLPLEVSPAPASLVRVLVGRIELFRPEERRTLAGSMEPEAFGDAFRRYGRFAEPFIELARRDSLAVRSRR